MVQFRSTRLRALAAGAVLAAGFVSHAQTPPRTPVADTPRVVIDTSLRQHAGRLVSISGSAVTMRDEVGRVMTFPRAEVVAIVPALAAAQAPPAARTRPLPSIRLVDGQVLPGTLRYDRAAPAELVRWESVALGMISVSLEEISTIILQPELFKADVPRQTSADAVQLVNGDLAQGFVAAVGASVVVEADSGKSTIDRTRVVGIHLANSAKDPTGMWVWLPDGSAIAAKAVEVSADGTAMYVPVVTTELPGGMVHAEGHDLRAVLLDASRVRALASLPRTVVDAAESRRWTPPVTIGDAGQATLFAADINLPGPIAVDWTLPAHAERVSMTIEMPPAARVWGDCEVVASLDGHELSRVRVNGQAPHAEFNLPLRCDEGGRLRITIEAGAGGPIQDHVIVRRAIVLLSPRATAP